MNQLVLYHHIYKTGGTSIRRLARANYRPEQVVNLDAVARGDPAEWNLDHLAREHHEYYESLPAEKRAAIRCVVGHTVPLLVPAVDDRPVRAFCMLRDPVDRVVSLFRFVERGVARGQGGPGVSMLQKMRDLGWTLKDVYRQLGEGGGDSPELRRVFFPLFNEQVRQVLLAETHPFDVPFERGAELDGCRDRALELLSDRYLVGTQDRFSQSIRMFADAFGWSLAYVPHANVGSSTESAAGIDEETRSLIRAHNGADTELHRHFSEALRSAPATDRVSHLQGRARHLARRGARRARASLRRRSSTPPLGAGPEARHAATPVAGAPTFYPDREASELKAYLGDAYDPSRLRRWEEQLDEEYAGIGDEDLFYRSSEGYLYNLTAFAMTGTKLPYLRALAESLAPGATVLDYGCGIGSDGLFLIEAGYRVAFADFDNPSTRYLRWRLGHRALDARVYDLDREAPPEGFDLVYAFDVVEHVEDPFAFLGELERHAAMVLVNLLGPDPEDTPLHRALPIGGLLDHAARRGLILHRLHHGRSHLILYGTEPAGLLAMARSQMIRLRARVAR